MTVLFRCRIEKPILEKANRVTGKLGTSTAEMVRIFVAQIAESGKVPLKLEVPDTDGLVGPWERRAALLEEFYDPAKTW